MSRASVSGLFFMLFHMRFKITEPKKTVSNILLLYRNREGDDASQNDNISFGFIRIGVPAEVCLGG